MIFPKVTMDLQKYLKHSLYRDSISPSLNGLYCDGLIWIRKKKPTTLFHEFVHHIFCSIGNHNGSTRLFFDFCNLTFDFVHCTISHKNWRENIWQGIDVLQESWNDFLDFALCREVFEIEIQNI